MTLDGTNIQVIVVRVYAIVKPGCVVRVYATVKPGCVASSDPPIENLRRFEHLRVRSYVVASVTKNSTELLRQFLDEVLDIVRIQSSPSRFSKQEHAFDIINGRNVIPLPSVNRDEFFRMIVYRCARWFLLLRRMSFLNACCYV